MYRNYHARITTSPRGAETPVVTLVSFFVADCGEGTKAAARELIRQHFGARIARIGKAKMVEAPRKGCVVFSEADVLRQMVRQSAAKLVKAA